ncbi:MAG: hypothetical protein P4L84_20975 [Isosphaeraceae bacterium]|nr:hypothetical protein [Isosphaeraceae bacterium]
MIPSLLAKLVLALALAGQTATADGSLQAGSAERLEFMKESVRGYEMTGSGGQPGALKLQPDPAFRLGKQGADSLVDGAIFFWTTETGRPEIAIQVFLVKTVREPEGLWVHEFTSLSPAPVSATRNSRVAWAPRQPGVEFRPVPGAGKPADTPAQRQRQMHDLAQGFKASDNFHGKGWSELRLLAKPIARYGKARSETLDGALFAFVLGTDPEVFVFLEARAGRDGLEWQYALAPMTVFAVKAAYRETPVWSLPDRDPANDPVRPFFDTTYVP